MLRENGADGGSLCMSHAQGRLATGVRSVFILFYLIRTPEQ